MLETLLGIFLALQVWQIVGTSFEYTLPEITLDTQTNNF